MAAALQKYLWPFYRADGSASAAHVVSLCVLVNEKFREGVPAWDAITGVVTSEGEIEVTDRCCAVMYCIGPDVGSSDWVLQVLALFRSPMGRSRLATLFRCRRIQLAVRMHILIRFVFA
jgi:hypothetical protein